MFRCMSCGLPGDRLPPGTRCVCGVVAKAPRDAAELRGAKFREPTTAKPQPGFRCDRKVHVFVVGDRELMERPCDCWDKLP